MYEQERANGYIYLKKKYQVQAHFFALFTHGLVFFCTRLLSSPVALIDFRFDEAIQWPSVFRCSSWRDCVKIKR